MLISRPVAGKGPTFKGSQPTVGTLEAGSSYLSLHPTGEYVCLCCVCVPMVWQVWYMCTCGMWYACVPAVCVHMICMSIVCIRACSVCECGMWCVCVYSVCASDVCDCVYVMYVCAHVVYVPVVCVHACGGCVCSEEICKHRGGCDI